MKQLALDGFPEPVEKSNKTGRDASGRFMAAITPKEAPPTSAEVATISRAEFYNPISIYEYPNLSVIVRTRSNGQGIRFYDTMEGTDADLTSFSRDLMDDVLHYPTSITAAKVANGQRHADFFRYALDQIPNKQNVVRHFLSAYMRGFSVTEKMYRVVDRGDWQGAVIYDALLDKPQRWFTFGMQRELRFRTFQNFIPGEAVDPDKFIVVTFGSTSNPYGEAMLDLCYWPWYLKHNALKNQAIFMEKWASPTAKAEYEWTNSEKLNLENRNKALTVLQAMQNDSSIAVPKGMIISLIESMRNGTVSFEGYINQLTEMESRIVTGQLLTSMGAEGGSHALGKVHEKRAANKVEMLATFVSHAISRYIGRDLIDRNFGPQDAYPVFKILARSPLSKQADVEIEKALIANGHQISRQWADEAFDIVAPTGSGDILAPPPGVNPSQDLPVSSGLAAPIKFAAAPPDLHRAAKQAGKAVLAQHKDIGRKAVATAKPAIKAVTKSIAANSVGTKPKANATKKKDVYGALKSTDPAAVNSLGGAMDTMLAPAQFKRHDPIVGGVSLAEADGGEPAPPAISDEAKLALALQMIAIADRIHDASSSAPEEMTGADAANSMTDPAGVAVNTAFSNLFEGTHATNIASLATADLRRRLQSADFRQKFPYVMIVATNSNVRLSHRMLDGYIISSEEARYSPYLPPFDFGCDCKAIAISAADAKAYGLTGAMPTGDIPSYLKAAGATAGPQGWTTPSGQSFYPGAAPGFAPAYSNTDSQAQLAALRTKAEDLRHEDPEAWASLNLWLVWLFGYDVLSQDPQQQPEED